MDLVFDTRTIARPLALNGPGEQGRAIQRAADNSVSPRMGVGDPAAALFGVLLALTEKRHHRPGLVAPLRFKRLKIHRAPVDSGRRTGFKTSDAQRPRAQPRGQGLGRRIAGPTARTASQAHVHLPAEKSARGQHHARGPKA